MKCKDNFEKYITNPIIYYNIVRKSLFNYTLTSCCNNNKYNNT